MAHHRITGRPWTLQEEQRHLGSPIEWWAMETFFSTDKGRHYSIKVALTEWYYDKNDHGSMYNITIFDEDDDTIMTHRVYRSDYFTKTDPQKIDLHYGTTWLTGKYPLYKMHLTHPDDDFDIELTLDSTSMPYWIAKKATDGWLPLGIGFYRYGFIPKMTPSGTIKIKGRQQERIEDGNGYYEHVWGDFNYKRPYPNNLQDLKKSITTIGRLIAWWKKDKKITRLPDSIHLTSENNPLGYDWAWAILDNGWSLFYGNILLWLTDGPAPGTLILTRDGKEYTEYKDIHFSYHTTKTIDTHDTRYPTSFTITAKDDDEILTLTFTMTRTPREYISPFEHRLLHWTGIAICEAPGIVIGTYTKKEKSVALKGIAKIEPQRQLNIFGHNSLCIEFAKPPHGVGMMLHLDSHYLQKRLICGVLFKPWPHLRFHITSNAVENQRDNG